MVLEAHKAAPGILLSALLSRVDSSDFESGNHPKNKNIKNQKHALAIWGQSAISDALFGFSKSLWPVIMGALHTQALLPSKTC